MSLTNPDKLINVQELQYFEGKMADKYATLAGVAATYATKSALTAATIIPIDIDELVPGMTFEQNAILGINGVMYRAVRQTTDFPVVLLVESGHIVYDEDEEGRKALVVDDYTLSEDWEIWSDAGIPRTLEQMTDDQEDFMAQEQADMAAFKQEIRNDAAQLIVLAAASLKPGTKITSSSGTEYTAEALLTAVADLMESTIVVNDEESSE